MRGRRPCSALTGANQYQAALAVELVVTGRADEGPDAAARPLEQALHARRPGAGHEQRRAGRCARRAAGCGQNRASTDIEAGRSSTVR